MSDEENNHTGDVGLTPEEVVKIQVENAELRELLKLAVHDMGHIAEKSVCRCNLCTKPRYREVCGNCNFRWKHMHEVEEVLRSGR